MGDISPVSTRIRAGFTLVELMVVLAVLGVLATVAIPSLMRFRDRAKTAEARINLAKLFDGTVAFFVQERIGRGELHGLNGATETSGALHRCPHPTDSPEGGSAGVTPALAVHCHEGPNARCVPGSGANGDGTYDIAAWSDNAVWASLAFQLEQSHYFHYDYLAVNTTTGYGACQFTSRALGNLDGDDEFSTFERTGAADRFGVNASAGLIIRQPNE